MLSIARECGVTVDVDLLEITLTRTETGLVAKVNGEAADFARAVGLLKEAEKVWLVSEVLSAAQPVGKRPAYLVHKELGRLGYRNGHYDLASQALERPVGSLAALTAEELATVRSYADGQLGRLTGSVAA